MYEKPEPKYEGVQVFIHKFDDPNRAPVLTNPTLSKLVRFLPTVEFRHEMHLEIKRDEHNFLTISTWEPPYFSMIFRENRIQFHRSRLDGEQAANGCVYFLKQECLALFRLVFDADGNRLSDKQVLDRRKTEMDRQFERLTREAVAEAGLLYANKEFDQYVQMLEPFEDYLGKLDAKKLSLARKRIDPS